MGDNTTSSLDTYLAFILFFLFVFATFLVFYYAEPGFPIQTYATLIIGYFSSFAILLLVPIDIAVVVYDRKSNLIGHDPNYNDNIKTLSIAYNVFFTIILIFGSVVLVFEEYYNTDGYFTLAGKLWSSFKRMTFDLALGAIAGVIILGILLGQHVVGSDANALKLAAVIVTNTVYEFILMFLLGYALVEFPRSIWGRADLDNYLLKTQMKAAADFKDISEAEFEISLVVSNVLKTKQQLANYADPILAQAMQILSSECPTEFTSTRQGKVAANKSGQITIDTLAALRTELNFKKDRYRMAQAKVEATKLLAYRLEDVVKAKDATNESDKVIHWSLSGKDSSKREYEWEVQYKAYVIKSVAVLLLILSLFSFLGVVCSMTGVVNEVSIYYLAVHAEQASLGGITLFIFITLGYTAYITMWAIFQIKISGMLELVPYRTTPESLSTNVRACARFAAPLAFFYLGWISENGIKSGSWQYNNAPSTIQLQNVTYHNSTSGVTYYKLTNVTVSQSFPMPSAFSNFYQLQSIGAVQQIFGLIYPIILYIVLFLFVTNFFNRILVMFKLEKYQFGAAIVTEEQLREGKRQLDRHKQRTIRAHRRASLSSLIINVAKAAVSTNPPDGNTRPYFLRLLAAMTGQGANDDDEDVESKTEQSVQEPPALFGAVEMKETSFMGMGSSWKEFYAEVRSPGFLRIYKDKKSALSDRKASPSAFTEGVTVIVVDLRRVTDFSVAPQKSKEELDIEIFQIDEPPFKIRLKSWDEAMRWRSLLVLWKDFNVDYGTTYPNGLEGRTGAIASASFKSDASSRASSSNAGSLATNRFSDDTTKEIDALVNAAKGELGNFPKGDQRSGKAFFSSSGNRKNDLDDVQVDVDDDGEDERESLAEHKGVRPLINNKNSNSSSSGSTNRNSGGFFGELNKKRATDEVSKPGKKILDKRPAPLEGWLEKKSSGKVSLGSDWQKRYVRVDESSGLLLFSKSSDPQEKPAGSIDLKLANEICGYDKGGKTDYSRINIDMGEKVFKFKAVSENEGRRWVHGLNEWKDYFLLNILIAIGNALFLVGLLFCLGFKRTLNLFMRTDRVRGTICFFAGIALVLVRWSLVGMILEGFGFLNLFGNFLPTVLNVARMVPILSRFLDLPIISQMVDYIAGKTRPKYSA